MPRRPTPRACRDTLPVVQDPAGPPPPTQANVQHTMATAPRVLTLVGSSIAAVSLLVTTILLLIGPPFWVDWALDAHGKTVTADVSLPEPTRSSSGFGRGGTRAAKVTARFVDHQGVSRNVELRTHNPASVIPASQNGTATIEYHPDHPQWAREVGESASIFGYWVFLPGGIGSLGMLIAAIGVALHRNLLNAWRRRLVARGRICGVGRTGKRRGQLVTEVNYSFAVGDRAYFGRGLTTRPVAVEDPIWVLFDPKNPLSSVCWPSV